MNIKLELSEDKKYVRIRTYTIVDGKEKMNQVTESYSTVKEIKWAARILRLPKFVKFLLLKVRFGRRRYVLNTIRYWNYHGVDLTKVYSDIKTLINTK